MDFKKQMSIHREAINNLEEEERKYLLEKFKDFEGKCFKICPDGFFKIKTVDYVYSESKINCTGTFARINYKTIPSYDPKYSTNINLDDDTEKEVTENDFKEHVQRVVNMIYKDSLGM